MDSYAFLDALAAYHTRQVTMAEAYERGDEEQYWKEQDQFVLACQRLRCMRLLCKNAQEIEQKFQWMVDYPTRTSSRAEALNRRLRVFTQAKRHATDRQLLLMQLHHNTTPFTADAKRAGKSPWQWLGLDVPGLAEGFVGVLRAANTGQSWPSSWAMKH